jgi:hypothetical protein
MRLLRRCWAWLRLGYWVVAGESVENEHRGVRR